MSDYKLSLDAAGNVTTEYSQMLQGYQGYHKGKRRNRMMLSEIYKELEGSGTLYDFADAVVKARLKMTRDMYLEEIERLDNMGKLSEFQLQDHEELLGDVVALTRVIKFYGFEEDADD